MSPLVSGQIYALLNTEFPTTEVVEYLVTDKFISQSDLKLIMASPINKVSSKGLDRHYHKYPNLSYRTRWDISDNVCLDTFKAPPTKCHPSYQVKSMHSWTQNSQLQKSLNI
jgi:hypothetical protein